MFIYSRNAVELAKIEDKENLAMELLKTNTPYDLAIMLADKIIAERPQKKVVVSPEDFEAIKALFRVRGFADDGITKIGRGRKKKPNEDYND